jgi:hypothetical protein
VRIAGFDVVQKVGEGFVLHFRFFQMDANVELIKPH